MRLASLRIDTLPGLERSLEVERFGPGVNVVLGPNASGKSSLIRALLAILYPGEHDDEVIDARAELVDGSGVAYRARRLGKVVGWERGGSPVEAPRLPPGHLIGTYVLRLEDLLGPVDTEPRGKRGGRAGAAARERLDAHIAQRLDKELSGGIDLKAVRRALGSQAEKGQKLAAELRAATAAHAELRRGRAELHRQEAKLTHAKAEHERVSAEAARKHQIGDASGLLEASLARASARAELASFPAQLGELLGNEADEYAESLSAMDRGDHDLERLDELAANANRGLAELGLPETHTAATAELYLDLAESLVATSEKCAAKEREIVGLRARHEQARRRLGGSWPAGPAGPTDPLASGPVVRLDDETLERVERLLEQRQAARAELHERRRQLEEMSRLVEPGDDEALLDVPAGVFRGGRTRDGMASTLRGIRHDLVRWLGEPLDQPRRPDWAWAVALGLAVLTVAAAGAGATGGWLAALAGLTTGWLGVTWLVLQPPRSAVKARIEADVAALQESTDIALPGEWDHGSVVEMIFDIDDEIARREASEREAEHFDERLRQLTGDASLAQKRVKALQSELEGLRGEVGFAVGPDIGLALWLQAAREVEATQTLLSAATTELDRHAREADLARRRLSRYLAEGGLAPIAEAGQDDPLEIRARCRELLRRARARDELSAEQERLRRERERLEAEQRTQHGRQTDILERAGVALGSGSGQQADRHAVQRALAALVARLPSWRQARERLQAMETLVTELSTRVGHDAELLAAALAHDRAALEAAAAAAERAAERARELNRDIHRTERDVENAGSERRLQQAAARVRAASDALLAHRQLASELGAAEFMLDTVEAEHEAAGRPAALKRAASWFDSFTHGEFGLTFEPGGGGGRRLGARDVSSGRALELAELSTGTRSQLLLASRLAFALEAEEGSLPLPFFLDEALTTSDARRFKEVAAAVMSVACRDGRQFVYLSARDDDAELWRQVAAEHDADVTVIDSLALTT